MNIKKHHYKASVTWTGNNGEGTSNYQAYRRDYSVAINGKPDFHGSADPAFRGDAGKYNPEDMLLMALSSCHMLWFLHLCADNGIVVTDYTDQAEAFMDETPGQGGQFTKVILHPQVRIVDAGGLEKIAFLHQEAGKKCFIANSCNFPVEYEGNCGT